VFFEKKLFFILSDFSRQVKYVFLLVFDGLNAAFIKVCTG